MPKRHTQNDFTADFPELIIPAAESSESKNSTMLLKGIACSPGIAAGNSFVIKTDNLVMPLENIAPSEVDDELARFKSALNDVTAEFISALEKVKKEAQNIVAIVETNLMIISDPLLTGSIERRISQGFSVENAIVQEFDNLKRYFKLSHDEIIRERAVELDQIKDRLLSALRNRCIYYAIPKDSVVIAQSVTPTDIINFKEAGVAAIVTDVGGIASHASILARSFEIPMVIGAKAATQFARDKATVVVDGFLGTVILNPSEDDLKDYEQKKIELLEHKKRLGALIKLPSVTTDGRKIILMSNIDSTDDINAALFINSEGIGLLRSEHLIMALKYFPTEDEQCEWYQDIAERMFPNTVTIRAFDIGSDKFSEGIPHHENNPALGFRGIRFLLSRRDLFEQQIKAILRASKNKNVRLMLPMITGVGEFKRSLEVINACKLKLDNEGIAYDKKIQIGVMIETPGAALVADRLAEHADFFSIGTNDLTQYTLAADRSNEMVSDVFDSFHPAVLRLIKITVSAAKHKGIHLGICGELAGHTAATALLVGLGVSEFSVSPSILLETKNRIRSIDAVEADKFAKRVLQCSTLEEVRRMLGLI